jgi:hypothetical protein
MGRRCYAVAHLINASDQAAGKVKHSEKVFTVTLIPHDQAPKILQPGK